MPGKGEERRIRLTVSYDGGAFHGWQVQPGLATIQSELQRAYAVIAKTDVLMQGSGRTDAGVHALAQVAAFSTTNRIPCDNLRRALNRVLPGSIRVLLAEDVSLAFHARFDAISKLYEYRIFRADICSPFERPYVHHFPYPLDEAKMTEAADAFLGTHDFRGFAASDERYDEGYSMTRTMFEATLRREGPRLIFRVRGSGFLKHMVRNMMGVLLEVGKGNVDQAGLREMLANGQRGAAATTAPACGLFLVSVTYPE